MSRVKIEGNASGTGTFTIQAPNSNSDRVLSLPDGAGEILTDASDIEAQVKTATNASGSAPIYACRAWVNFNGESTVAIRASGNVSSITDNGTGDYTVNFTNAISDSDYASIYQLAETSGSHDSLYNANYSATTTDFSLTAENQAGNLTDPAVVTIAIFR